MKKIKIMIKRSWIPYIILIVTLTVTVLSTYYVGRSANTEDRLRFLNAVQDTNSNIETKLLTYVTLLRGVGGLFAAESSVTKQQFNDYVTRLHLAKNYPGTVGVGYIQVVDNSNKNNFIESIQNEEDPQFTIVPDGNRSEYYVIRYLMLTNQQTPTIIGYDMGTNQSRLNAMQKARDLGKTTTSKRVMMRVGNSKNQTDGVLIFTPIYEGGTTPNTVAERREKLQGFIFTGFTTNTLFINQEENKTLPLLLNYQVYDGTQAASDDLIYDSKIVQNHISEFYHPRFKSTAQISISGETWTIIYSNHPQFDRVSQMSLTPIIFIGGLLISIMFFMLSRSQYIARTNAEITTAKLKRSQRELEKAIGMRDNFISIASHELKTPVTSLKVYTEVLLRQFMKKNDKKTVEHLTKIIKQIDKLTMLIQDLLNVSRIQSNQLTFRIEKFDLNALVKEVIESTQQIAEHHRIVLQGETSKYVWGDKERVGQVIINLLTNALKYSPKSNKVIVGIQDKKYEAEISVQDFGVGISKEHQKRIFERFYRISETNEQTYPGLGIGLFISQAIVKRHGGEITIISKKNKGSTFQFSLPYHRNQIPVED